jgi:beta-galactosidase
MKNKLFILVFVLSFQFLSASSYIIGEGRFSLNGQWQFRTDPKCTGELQGWHTKEYNDIQWEKIEVPGSWELENEHTNYIGKAWYRTSFHAPTSRGKRVLLEFESVSMSYRVFLNNKLVTKQIVGNYREQFDITDLLESSNTLAVEVDNSLSWGAYVNWGGIRRSVTLCVVEPIRVLRQEIVATPDLKAGTAVVAVKVILCNDKSIASTIKCQPDIFFEKKSILQLKAKEITIGPNSEAVCIFSFKLNKKQTHLWHIDFPNLYTLQLSLSENKQINVVFANRFGIRKLEVAGTKIKLNGEIVRLTGYNWVADDRLTANTLPVWRYKEDIDRMKELGCNLARLSHRPLPEEVMDYLDEKGIMSISEFNNWSHYMNPISTEPFEFATKLIQQQFNHASVIGWSVGNEMGNKLDQPLVNEYVESIVKHIKQNLDPTRLVAYVSNTADYQADDAAQYGDMIWINKYWNYEKGLDNLAKVYPDKAIYVTEYGGYGVEQGNLIYDTPNNTKYKNFVVDSFSSKEYLSGYSIWTFNDYRSRYQSPNPSTATPIHQNRQWGIVDNYRNKKRAYEQMKDFYAPVRKMVVTNDFSASQVTTYINIDARAKIDIPAFILKGYKLVWEVKSKDGLVHQGSFFKLPEVKPGEKSLSYKANWKKTDNAAMLKVTLLSPLGYSVKDTTLYLAKPAALKEFKVIQSDKFIRVVFERNEFCKEYALKYTLNGVTKTTPSTIDHYIDLKLSELNTPYSISVVGINEAGEGEPSKSVTVVGKNGFTTLPPVVWGIVPSASGFNLGIGWVYTDTLYEVRYSTTPADNSSWKIQAGIVFGAFKVSGLECGKKYFVQVRNATQFGSNRSVWSEMLEVTPGTKALTGNAIITGVLTSEKESVICINPASKASSYVLSYKIRDRIFKEVVNCSELKYYILKNRNNDILRDLNIQAIQ